MAALSALTAGAGFLTFATVGRITTHGVSLATAIHAAILLVVLISSALITQTISAKLGADFVTVLRKDLAEKLLYHPYAPTSPKSTDGLSTFINDIAEIAPLALTTPLTVYNGLFAVVIAGYLFYVSVPLSLLVFTLMGALLYLSAALLRAIGPAFDNLRRADDKLFSEINSLKSARKELLTNRYRAMHFNTHVIQPAIDQVNPLLRRAHVRLAYFSAWSSAVFYVVLVATAISSSLFFKISQPELISFMMGCLLIVGPSNYIISVAQQVARGVAAVRRIEKFSSGTRAARRVKSACSISCADWRVLSMQDVEYVYGDSNENGARVGPISLSVRRGEIVFLAGGNGSGKSTILLLISGLLDPLKGSVLLDNCNLFDIKQTYRDAVSVLFSDFHIFSHLLDGFGSPAINSSVQSKVAELGLMGIVDVSDGVLSRVEGSAGQRKRLALLQMMLEDRDLLILDEPAADLDPDFKNYFYTSLLGQLRSSGKTVIVASHDPKFFGCADRVLYMEDGRLVTSA